MRADPRPVAALAPDGRVELFASVKAAARAIRARLRERGDPAWCGPSNIRRWIRSGEPLERGALRGWRLRFARDALGSP